MRPWIVALRIGRREARRAKGRTALIVVMIGLPVLALAFAATIFGMQQLTPQDKATRLMGAADAIAFRGAQPGADGRYAPVHEDPAMAYQDFLGGADPGPHEAAVILPQLPAGSGATGAWQANVAVRTAHGLGDVKAYGLDAGSPIAKGLTRLVAGRMPANDREVAASPGALSRLGTAVGGTLTTTNGQRFTVVGVAEYAGRIDESLMFRPSAPITNTGGYWLIRQPGLMTWAQIQDLNRQGFFVQSRAMMLHPPRRPPTPRQRLAGLTPFNLGTVVGGLGLLEVVLLAGPAFTVGARRRQRDLALVAANGGTPAMLRRIVLADGLVAGLLAAVAGIAAGVALAFGLRGQLELHVFHTRMAGYRVNAPWLAGIAAIAVVTGLLGALVPAITAARQQIVPALAGRRGTHRSRVRWLLLGIALVVVGTAAAVAGAYQHHPNVVLAGLCTGEFGFVLATPAIVGQIARIGRFLPPAPRIALRDVSRRRAAAAPAISAVMAAVAGSIAVTVYLGAAQQQQSEVYVAAAPPGTVLMSTAGGAATPEPGRTEAGDAVAHVDAALDSVFPGVGTVGITTMACGPHHGGCYASLTPPPDRRCPYEVLPDLDRATIHKAKADPRCRLAQESYVTHLSTGQILTEDPAVVTAVTGLRGAALDRAVATLRAGGVLVTGASYVEHGRALLSLAHLVDHDAGQPAPAVPGLAPGTPPDELDISVPADVVPSGAGYGEPILSPATLAWMGAAGTGIGARVSWVAARPPAAPAVAQADALTEALHGFPAQIYVEDGYQVDRSPLPLVLAIAAGLVALGAAAIATGLAAADSRTDLITLAAVGAAPRMRRLLSLAQSGIIAGLGSLLGAIAGFGAAAAVITGVNQQYVDVWPAPEPVPILVPWTNLLVSLVVVPAVAMLGAGLLTRSRLPSERRAT